MAPSPGPILLPSPSKESVTVNNISERDDVTETTQSINNHRLPVDAGATARPLNQAGVLLAGMHGRPETNEACTLLGRVYNNTFTKATCAEEEEHEEAQAQAELRKQRHILCIGNDSYRSRTALCSAVSGAENVHNLFNELAFTCSLCQDATTSILRSKTRDFVSRLTDKSRFVVLFFAGHGEESDEEQRLLAIDAIDDGQQAADGPSDMTVNEVLKLFVESGAARDATFLLVLDCCRGRRSLPEVSRRKRDSLLAKCAHVGRQLAVLYSCPSGGLVLDEMGSVKRSPMEFLLTQILDRQQDFIDATSAPQHNFRSVVAESACKCR
ncbi:Mucosa-associated lymphoid tissue lymphoma translocation protein 1 [Symbiodinium microadriaticum]|uniref:Mucosa-associated lymphoid tissue lymphoma translocation protein 1 n=1 Tax=Symbiodinium microadriaticum TaxID=2951 RepID=A0A1Q9F703_SYMMI|nr:Mucosa-associated lymphoid tissue lymphoma translocation protein 1 [Symbiodinium microadriaticum]